MWVTSLLEKLLPALAEGVDSTSVIDESLIQSILVQLYKNVNLNPDATVRRTEGDFSDKLCELKLNLDDALATSINDNFKSSIQRSNELLDTLLSRDITFTESSPLINALQQCLKDSSEERRASKKRKSFFKQAILLTTILPVVAYGVHWTIANQIQSAVVEEVSVIYPANSYEFSDGVYKLREAVVDDAMKDFGNFYFNQESYARFNPLPLAYHLGRAHDIGVSLKDNNEFMRAMETGQLTESQLNESNLAVFRLFIRNIRDTNIVNNIQVSGERVRENSFPWDKVDVESTVSVDLFRDEYDVEYKGLEVTVDGAPITDLIMSAALVFENSQVGQEHVSEFGLVQNHARRSNSALSPLQWENDEWQFIYLSEQELAALDPDNSLEASIGGFEEFFYDREILANYLLDKPYVFFRCDNGGATLLIEGGRIKDTLDLPQANFIQVDAQYKLLDGRPQSLSESLALNGHYLLREGVDTSLSATQACIGDLAIYLYPAPIASHPGGWVGAIDSLAVSLMDTKTIAKASIVAEKSVLLDFAGKDEKRQQSFDDIHIFKDGDYVLLNVVVANMPGGTYEFSVRFDDERVAVTEFDMLWPQSLRFEESDVQYFRAGHAPR